MWRHIRARGNFRHRFNPDDLSFNAFVFWAWITTQGKIDVSEEYLRLTTDYVEVDRPRRLEFGGKLTITQWTRFPIYETADFGWGRPVYAEPIDLTPTPQVCVLLPEGEAEPSGRTVICICLSEFATGKFTELLVSGGRWRVVARKVFEEMSDWGEWW